MIGKQIQNYQVTGLLGQGGMGTVYRATDIILGRDVALKMLLTPMTAEPQVLERFKKEAQVLARLLHPNIAVIYNLIEHENQHFMVMEFVEGKDLDGLLKKHRTIPYLAVAASFIQGLEGLHHAHRKGIFHRDIKPSNLILTPDGTVKLMDFGIARVAGEQRLTQVNRVIGTIEFLAPELIEGKDPSVASDVYAAGMTMYELLCAKLPFQGGTDYNLMQEILKKRPPSPEKINSAVPAALANIVMKALEKKPENRYADAKAMQAALVTAYPSARDSDLTYLFNNAVVPVTQYMAAAAATREAGYAATGNVLKPTLMQQLRPAYLLRMLNLPRLTKLQFFQRINKRVALGLLAVLLLFITGFVVLSNMGDRRTPGTADGKDVPGDGKGPLAVNGGGGAVQASHVNDAGGANGGGGGIGGGGGPADPSNPANPGTPLNPPLNGEEKGEESKTGTGKEDAGNTDRSTEKKTGTGKDDNTTAKKKAEAGKEPVKKEDAKHDPVRDPVRDPVPGPAPEPKPVEKKAEPAPEEKRGPTQSMVLNAKPEVSLYLQQPLSSSSQTGQSLSFTVTSAVTYQGQTIIERGSIAYGRIKNVGNKKITVVLSSVNGIFGQRFPLQEVELSGRTDEMISNRVYSANLKKGISINY